VDGVEEEYDSEGEECGEEGAGEREEIELECIDIKWVGSTCMVVDPCITTRLEVAYHIQLVRIKIESQTDRADHGLNLFYIVFKIGVVRVSTDKGSRPAVSRWP
jgi:hypothetical protein